ncbi:hypothetical protein M440DRAFT_1391709 [Trichoderma longibrachiatum ATCC 18648]|uniref:PSMD12/CSN4-like N-terminal domain-containing protein n=1 Tax=Trichoderma longibrachiatum ATCC 18648 TaxID=983965 RepID=A0A2T4C3N1_TRILO|nr:hypothetical protein M440DRAFT_1391709 [Trichoderma longibrachiatum ATCC 18648]
MEPNPNVAAAIASAESASGDEKAAMAARYESILADLPSLASPAAPTAADLNAVFDSFFRQSPGLVASRAFLTTFVNTLKGIENEQLWIDVGTRTLDKLAAQPSSYFDAAATLYELLATAHENNDDFLDAAKALAEIPLDSSQRKVSDEDKARVWVRIVRNYLEVGDDTAADVYVNKLKNIMHTLLGLDAARAEETTARMIEQGRLVGRMDQLDGTVWFQGGEASGEKGSRRADVVANKEMRRWDANVEGLAEDVESVINSLQKEFPAFVAANLVS